MKGVKQVVLVAVLVALCIGAGGGFAAAMEKKTIIFADFGWDSAQVHNRIAGFIIEKG